MTCCREAEIIQRDCGMCPGPYSPRAWEVVIPVMANDTGPDVEEPFKTCTEHCFELAGSKIMTGDGQGETACTWEYREVIAPCSAISTHPLTLYVYTFIIAYITLSSINYTRYRFSVLICQNDGSNICIPPSYGLVVYETLDPSASPPGQCKSYTLPLCTSYNCNFFLDDKSCVWPAEITIESAY